MSESRVHMVEPIVVKPHEGHTAIAQLEEVPDPNGYDKYVPRHCLHNCTSECGLFDHLRSNRVQEELREEDQIADFDAVPEGRDYESAYHWESLYSVLRLCAVHESHLHVVFEPAISEAIPSCCALSPVQGCFETNHLDCSVLIVLLWLLLGPWPVRQTSRDEV